MGAWCLLGQGPLIPEDSVPGMWKSCPVPQFPPAAPVVDYRTQASAPGALLGAGTGLGPWPAWAAAGTGHPSVGREAETGPIGLHQQSGGPAPALWGCGVGVKGRPRATALPACPVSLRAFFYPLGNGAGRAGSSHAHCRLCPQAAPALPAPAPPTKLSTVTQSDVTEGALVLSTTSAPLDTP